MRRLIVLAAVLLSLVTGASAGPAATTAPTLRLVTMTPLTLRGSGFDSHEQVRVTLTTRTLARRSTLRANTGGAFTYRSSPLVAVEPCRGTLVVTALGLTSGLRATWKRACRPPDEWPAAKLILRRAA